MQMPSSISTRLHYQHKVLMDVIEGLTDEQIRRAVIPGKWSIFENIVHLQTYQHHFIQRVNRILEGNNPVFTRYTAEADPAFHEQCGRTSREILQDLISTRKEITAGMLNFPGSDLEKTGMHPVYGKMNMLEWINFFLLHESHHLFSVFKMAAELKRTAAG